MLIWPRNQSGPKKNRRIYRPGIGGLLVLSRHDEALKGYCRDCGMRPIALQFNIIDS